MIDVIGFWSVVTVFTVIPFWFFGYRITRWVLSIAKKSAPEIPREIRGSRAWSHWECHLYPRWAHKLTKMFGGDWLNTGGVAILGILSFIPVVTMITGAFNPKHTVIGLISDVATLGSTVMGWFFLVIGVAAAGYLAVSKISRLVGLVQIQEMKEKRSENR
ncbi:MAG: hypothetical protein ACRCTP_02270 [Aeromonas popoffii]|uniref:hypothetical protein n=1 Tax=Aeromonas popoffii TaxID=70856 RepID=UPI003F34C8A8